MSFGQWRLQAVTISLNKSKLLIINSFLPSNPRTIRFDDHDLFEVLTVINNINENNEFVNLRVT